MIGLSKLACTLLIILLPLTLSAKNCYLAVDFGQGGTLTVYANPNDDTALSTNQLSENNQIIRSKLLRVNPLSYQIAPWVDTQLYTTGVAAGSPNSNLYLTNLKGYITGAWYPWGYQSKDECDVRSCDPAKIEDNICLQEGIIINQDIMSDTIVYPCVAKNGLGLYGMVAIINNGQELDPNDLNNAINLPPNFFRTFHIYPLQDGREDQKYFEYTFLQQCINDNAKLVCKEDVDSAGRTYIPKGRLYFKISDSHYEDNTGSYGISIVSGVYIPKGFIQELIDAFKTNLNTITTKIYDSLSQSTYFIKICQAMLVLYVAIEGMLFIFGLTKTHYSELVKRLVKVGLIAALISPNSWYFFNTFLFQLFTDGVEYIATTITKLTLYNGDNYNSPMFLIPENANELAVFDNFFRLLTSKQVHFKILSMLLYDWHAFVIPFIYVGIFFIITGIVKAAMMYILALLQIALLLIVAPIFIIMILFQFTKTLFDEWIKQLIASSLVIIIVFSTIALLMTLILEQLQQLLYYDICWVSVFRDDVTSLNLFDVYFWYPDSPSQVGEAITFGNYFSFLVVCLIFESFIKEIPKLADALSAAQRPTITRSFSGFEGMANQSTLMNLPSYAKGVGQAGGGGVIDLLSKVPVLGVGIRGVRAGVGIASSSYDRTVGAVTNVVDATLGPGGSIIPKDRRGNDDISINLAAPVKALTQKTENVINDVIKRKE